MMYTIKVLVSSNNYLMTSISLLIVSLEFRYFLWVIKDSTKILEGDKI